MSLLSNLSRAALFSLDAERAHKLSISALKVGQSNPLMSACPNNRHPQLAVQLAGLVFPNPIGMAAGFDKNGEVPDGLAKLGLGHVEVGTVTPRAQSGNPTPRIFRLVHDKAVINRLGFNNLGHDAMIANLEKRRRNTILGINIGANKDSADFIKDYECGLEKFWHLADYFTLNISSPNTPGLRDLQAKNALTQLLKNTTRQAQKLAEANGNVVPLFLKISPDLDEIAMDEIARCIHASTIEGLIVSNTTLARPDLQESTRESGGLSGRPLFRPSTIVLAKMRQRLGDAFPIIGVGGVDSVDTAWDKIAAGANLVQIYTGLIYHGPGLPKLICNGLADKLKASSLDNIQALCASRCDEWAAHSLPSGK